MALRVRKSRRRKTKAVPWSAIRKHNRKRKASDLEVTVTAWLKEAKVKFKREKAIGYRHVDMFFEPDTILELNGCYWHGCTACYPDKPSEFHRIARRKDKIRYAAFENRGFKVIVVRECEMKADAEAVRQLILSSIPRK